MVRIMSNEGGARKGTPLSKFTRIDQIPLRDITR